MPFPSLAVWGNLNNVNSLQNKDPAASKETLSSSMDYFLFKCHLQLTFRAYCCLRIISTLIV